MTRPFDFADFQKRSLYDMIYDSGLFDKKGVPLRDIHFVDQIEDTKDSFGYGKAYTFSDGYVLKTFKPFGISILKNCSSVLYHSIHYDCLTVSAKNVSYRTNSKGVFTFKRYGLKNVTFTITDGNELEWSYGPDFSTRFVESWFSQNRHHEWFFGSRRFVIKETMNKKHEVKSTYFKVDLPGDYYNTRVECMLVYDEKKRIHFTLVVDDKQYIDQILPNMPSICPTHLWNDEYMFEAQLKLCEKGSEYFEKAKATFEKHIDKEISKEYYNPHPKGIRRLIDEQKNQ